MKEITKDLKDYLLSIGYPSQKKIYYLDVWLWLWREKKCYIQTLLFKANVFKAYIFNYGQSYNFVLSSNDPEEAIIAAINYLVDNNLIK